jgi:hypothetical protein
VRVCAAGSSAVIGSRHDVTASLQDSFPPSTSVPESALPRREYSSLTGSSRRRQPQDDVAIALPLAAQSPEPVDHRTVEPDEP